MAISSGSIMEFMNLGFPEMIFIFLLALIIFGPKKLRELGSQIGKALNEFKRASNEFKSQIESEINSLDVEIPRQTILPPAPPPVGAIAAGNHESSPEVNSATKAPDAWISCCSASRRPAGRIHARHELPRAPGGIAPHDYLRHHRGRSRFLCLLGLRRTHL